MNRFGIGWVLMASLTGFTAAYSLPLSAHEASEAAHEATSSGPHGDHQAPNHSHSHGSVEVPAGQPVPTVSLVIHPDSRRGWNLEMQVTNFTFAPEHVNQADGVSTSSTLEGHAHLYIDGVKITRIYGNWYYLESLSPGMHQISVSLNTNSHATLMYNGQPIQATVMLDVAAQ